MQNFKLEEFFENMEFNLEHYGEYIFELCFNVLLTIFLLFQLLYPTILPKIIDNLRRTPVQNADKICLCYATIYAYYCYPLMLFLIK